MIEADLLIHSAGQLLTLAGGPRRGPDLGRLGIIDDGALAIRDGRITVVGRSADLCAQVRAARLIDAAGRVVMPGLVDPHTHVVFVGDRVAEFEMRLAGRSYLDILAAGGGILSTVRATRQASVEAMMAETRPRLQRMLAHGTTTAEAKTGYGLDLDTELRMLEAIVRLNNEGPIRLVPTFLGAHAVPPEYQGRSDDYVEHLCCTLLPAVRDWWSHKAATQPVPFVDVFCERGAFDLAQTRRILETAQALGFRLKVHVDEFESLGGARLAAELGAISADHLVTTPHADLLALARSTTVAVALPCTPFGLAEDAYTPARELLEAGALLAVASDLNPGTAWCESMQFVIALACRYLRLTPAEAVAAATINAAAAVGLADQVGSLEEGKLADVVILEVPDYRHLGYRFGTNLVSTVLRAGQVVQGNEPSPW